MISMLPPECPALRSLLEREQEVLASAVCSGEKATFREFTVDQIALLTQAAAAIGCAQLQKDIPPIDQALPAFGQERMDFARLCPAYSTYRELQTQQER